VAAGLGFSPAAAQETLPEIVVAAPAASAAELQPTNELGREDIERSDTASLADTLATRPGLAASTFAPGASRPVIRGLGDYRVRVQENGVGVHDASDFSPDHGVPIDPLITDRIEVIRGPATLRYGSQAIGGVVNTSNNRIPEAIPPNGFAGRVSGSFNSVNTGTDAAAVLDAGHGAFAVHADASLRRAGDYRIPGGRQSNSALDAKSQALGSSYIFDGGYAGLSVSHNTSLYHIPGIAETRDNTRIDLRQTSIASKGEWRAPFAAIDAIRYTFGASDYVHYELGRNTTGIDGVQNTIRNREQEGRIEFDHAPLATTFGALTGNWGVQILHRQLGTEGNLGGLLAPTDTLSFAGYAFEQMQLTDTLTVQGALRIESATVAGTAAVFPSSFLPPPATVPQSDAQRRFTPASAGIGLAQALPYDITATLSAHYAQRAPAAPELYSRGSDDASGTFVIGNSNLKIETAKSVEFGLKRRSGAFRFDANLYATRYDDFIFKQLTGNFCVDEFATCGAAGPLIQVVYGQRDALFRGGEFSAQLDVAPLAGGTFGIDTQFDVVRATFTDGSYVPRIPPMRAGGGLWWRNAEWQARIGLLHAFAQTRTGLNETPTDSYNLLKAEISRTQPITDPAFGVREVTYGIVGDNLLDENIRNHVSFKKDEVLQPGRTVRLFATARF
jgi:iron complex outermembrane receptor protein